LPEAQRYCKGRSSHFHQASAREGNCVETSLHRSLKQLYCTPDAELEAAVEGYRVDVLRGELIVEVQTCSLAALAGRLGRLLESHHVLVVKPITHRKLLVWHTRRGGPETSRRMSPKRGRIIDVFAELVHLVRIFPHPNLAIELLLIDEEEHRVRRARTRRGYVVCDRRLGSIRSSRRLAAAADLLALLPEPLPAEFTTRDIAQLLDVAPWFARAIAYTLRHSGAAHACGRTRSGHILYRLACESVGAGPQASSPAA